MVKCPRCFQPVPAYPVEGYCEQGRCNPGDVVATLRGPVGGGGGRRRRQQPAPPAFPCGAGPASHGETCQFCDYRMPVGWRDAPTSCVVMAGARATGKSIYIGVLVKQLEQWGEWAQVRVRPANEQVAQMYRDVYEKPLYEQRGIMEPTPSISSTTSYQREPLIFELSTGAGVQHRVAIRDVAGEDLEATSLDRGRLGFFASADAVLFLFDPLRVEEIHSKLEGLVPQHGLQVNTPLGQPVRVLENTLGLSTGGQPKLAVILSKFDAVQELRRVRGNEWSRIMSNAGAAFFRDPGPLSHYDDADGELLHEEVRSLLQRLEAGMVMTVESASQQMRIPYRYFAVSALGDPPAGSRLSDRGIAPFRCLDPVKWVVPNLGRW